MSIVKGVVHGIKSFFGAEPASDNRAASTNEDAAAASPIPFDLTTESESPELPEFEYKSSDGIVNETTTERRRQREQRQQTTDQEIHIENTSTPKSIERTQTTISLSRNSLRVSDARKSNKRDRSSPEERRALGIPEKTPHDAVIVAIPTSPFETSDTNMLDMAPQMRRITPNQPFRPLNTLDAQPTPKSARQQLMTDKIGNGALKREDTKVVKKQYSSSNKIGANSIRANDHEVPQKRLRVGPSPLEGTAKDHAINLDDSQERPPLRPLHTSPLGSYSSLNEGWPTGSRLLQPAILLDTGPPKRDSRIPKLSQNRDELYEEETENFTKNARAQRLQEEGLQLSDRRLNRNNSSKLEQLNKHLESSPDPIEQQSTTSGYFRNAPSIRNASKQVRLPDESPDALQVDAAHTIQESPKRQNAPVRSKNPSVVADSITDRSNRAREKSRQSKAPERTMQYSLDAVLHPDMDHSDGYLLVLNLAAKSLQIIETKSYLDNRVLDTSLDALQKIICSSESKKVMVHFRGGVSSTRYFLIDFSSLKTCVDFLKVIQSLTSSLQIQEKEDSYVEKVFENGPQKMKEFSQHAMMKSPHRRRSNDREMFPKIREGQKLGSAKQSRLVDRLDRPPDIIEEPVSSSTIITGADRSGERPTRVSRQRPITIESEVSVDMIEDSRKLRTARTGRTTRSQASDLPSSTLSRPDVYENRNPWKQPLVYPTNGKNCATIVYDDLKRLNDDEFLNDNLVGLFLRYLQEHATPDALGRMHFFNSFFFEALTKERKSKSGINYEAVSRWTKKINIFKRDFVIVPVNESHHWFVMIICNLPRLKKAHDPEEQGEETDEIEEIAPPNTMHDGKIVLSSDLPMISETAARESFQELSLDESSKEPSSASHRKGGKRKFKRALPKYDIDAPVIITLDSLDQPRSGTATALRSYIQHLAADERQAHQAFQIDAKAEIKGMTGKGIPHQTNFSDCGLYLCMYLEQFMTDPTKFVQRILRREEAEQGWPTNIESGTLRDRLLNMIVELQKQQESKGSYDAKIPPIGSILVDMQIPEANQRHRQILAAKEHWQQQKASEEPEMLSSPPQRIAREHANRADKTVKPPSSNSENRARDSAIIIEDGPVRQTDSRSQYFQKKSDERSVENSFGSSIPVVQLDTPEDMAARMREERSPEQEFAELEPASESMSSEKERHVSISTDFLSSDEQFRMNDFLDVQSSKAESESGKPSRDEGKSRTKKSGQVNHKSHSRKISHDDGLDIAHEMIFED